MATKQGTTKTAPTRDSIRVANAKKAHDELDEALAKFARRSSKENAIEMEKLLHLQETIEKRIGGKAYVIFPDKPMPVELVERVIAEQPGMSASEALYAFMGWLTTRERPIILSEKHNADVVPKLIGAFIDEQKLATPRSNWGKYAKNMADIFTHVTNDPALSQTQCAPPPPSFDEAYGKIVGLLRFFPDQRQNHLLARLLEEIREGRAAEFHVLTDKIGQQTERHTQLADASKELDQVLSGNFTIVHA